MNEKNTRKCPGCKKELFYSTKWSCIKAEQNGVKCKSCSKRGENNPQFGNVGDKNPFYGKKHSIEVVEKIRKEKIGKKYSDEINKKKASIGKDNPMYGKSFYDVWVEKYGEEEAGRKMQHYKERKSEQTSGKNNPMYGKPAPVGSGNGWSGWYKGWYFRSLHELSYMVNVIERFNISWESAEKNKWSVKYVDWDGIEKNYFPDFILEGKYMVECKPKNLWESETVKRKKDAGVKKCKELGLTYKIVSPIILKEEEVLSLYINGDIKFLEKYEKKMLERNEINRRTKN